MKRSTTILSLLLFWVSLSSAQVTLVKWTFPDGTPSDSIADGGIPANAMSAIHTEGGTSAIDFSKNGATTKAAQATGWDNGSLLKCWVVKLNTKGYENLKISSKMQSGGNNPGPRDFIIQYRTNISGTWTDIPGTTIITANDWTTGWLDSVALPAACNNQEMLYLRWIMNSNLNSQGGALTSGGINKIDDIYVTGKLTSTGLQQTLNRAQFTMFPNPTASRLNIRSTCPIVNWQIMDISGRTIQSIASTPSTNIQLDLNNLSEGSYFVRIRLSDGKEATEKFFVIK
jgi:hypothetical protein